MYLSYERIDVTTTVKTVAALTVPAKATHAELQADAGTVRYTMDNATNPSSTLPRGMVLAVGHEPKTVSVEDLRRIRFCIEGASGTFGLNIHYFGGRDI